MVAEKWKPVVGWEHVYEVSNLGRVRRAKATRGTRVGRVLRPAPHSTDGYPQVNLCADGRQRTYCVHQLVAAAWLGECPDGFEVSHEDGDPWNCRVSNLRYRTHLDNVQRSKALGMHSVGEMRPTARLTPQAVREIRALSGVVPQKTLAVRYGVSPTRISEVIARRAWKHVEEVSA